MAKIAFNGDHAGISAIINIIFYKHAITFLKMSRFANLP